MTAEELHGVFHDGAQNRESVGDTRRTPREIHDQGGAAHPGDPARERRMRGGVAPGRADG